MRLVHNRPRSRKRSRCRRTRRSGRKRKRPRSKRKSRMRQRTSSRACLASDDIFLSRNRASPDTKKARAASGIFSYGKSLMPNRNQDAAFRSIIDRFTRDLTSAIAQHVEEQVSVALSRMHLTDGARSQADGRRSGRLCPVPGCGKPGAGPRNRWFCKDHSKKLSATEQKSILERNRRLAAEGKLPTAVPAQRIVRLPAKAPRPRRALDMSCRVEGCTNRSRGPRAGFICDQHRAELPSDEQRAARERGNAGKRGGGGGISEQPKSPPAPVPPIVRKGESAGA